DGLHVRDAAADPAHGLRAGLSDAPDGLPSGLAGTAEELPADALTAGAAGAPEPGAGQGRRLTAGAKETTMTMLDETHDPAARSWVASAQAEGCDFPLQNLPFAVFRRAGTNEAFRGG